MSCSLSKSTNCGSGTSKRLGPQRSSAAITRASLPSPELRRYVSNVSCAVQQTAQHWASTSNTGQPQRRQSQERSATDLWPNIRRLPPTAHGCTALTYVVQLGVITIKCESTQSKHVLITLKHGEPRLKSWTNQGAYTFHRHTHHLSQSHTTSRASKLGFAFPDCTSEDGILLVLRPLSVPRRACVGYLSLWKATCSAL